MNVPPRGPDPEAIAADTSATPEFRNEVHPVSPRPSLSISKEDVRSVPETALRKPVRIVQVRPVDEKRTSGKAIAALVFGVAGVLLMGILVGPVAILFGVWALFETKRTSYLTGRRMAISGIVLGFVAIILWVGLFLIWGLTLLTGA